VLNAVYQDHLDVTGLPPAAAGAARDSAAAAVAVGSPAVARSAREAFVAGMDVTLWVCSGLALVSIVLALAFLPRRTPVTAPEPDKVATIKA
jgi:DHA2 family multidrug resistance protein-like MFS transporter